MKIDNNMQLLYAQLSSGKRITSAAVDPAGLGISNQMNSQIKGYDKGTDNVSTSKDLATTAEGALSSIEDNLGRIRELAVQASNGTYTAEDRKLIQNEINQLKNGIQDAARNTEFNTIKLLDGSVNNFNTVSGPSGTGTTMTIKNTSLETLGIDQFDVTQNFNIDDIDKAIAQVSESRSNLGAISNRFDYQINVNNTASANLSSAEDKISNVNMEKAITDLKQIQLMQNIQFYVQQTKMNQSSGTLNLLK